MFTTEPPAHPTAAVENWKPVLEAPTLYAVSDQGRVFSILSRKILAPGMNHSGYPLVNLYYDKKGHTRVVHRLVAKTFLPPPTTPDQEWVNHINGIRDDARLTNLEWVTPAGNVEHACRVTGKMIDISAETIDQICEMWRREYSQEAIASQTGVSRGYISAIVNGIARKHCNPEGVAKADAPVVDLSETPEEWRPIRGFEHMEISNKGRCRRIENGRILTPVLMSIGYYKYALRRDNKTFQSYAHRLVADAFLPACPEDGQRWIVNHKIAGPDGKPGTLNDVRNLEWITHRQNIRHAHGHKYGRVSADAGVSAGEKPITGIRSKVRTPEQEAVLEAAVDAWVNL